MTGSAWFRLLLVFPMCMMLGSCSRGQAIVLPEVSETSVVAQEEVNAPARQAVQDDVHNVWFPLLQRLESDGLAGPEVNYLFMRLGSTPSQDPMGRKVEELYTSKFLRPARSTKKPEIVPTDSKIPQPWYKGIVTDANARRCRNFINANAEAFQNASEQFGVPAEVGAALLFVETRLGEYLGKENVFITLASMSASTSPEIIPDWLQKLPGIENHMDWVQERMEDKSNWAYTELRALVRYSLENGVDPFEVPGSVYGALGLCQFMPSNISRFALDGNGDKIIDLFSPDDAVASLSNYLAKHGWKEKMSMAEKQKVLKRYNNLNIYANTILALAEKISSIPGRPAVNRPLPKGPDRG